MKFLLPLVFIGSYHGLCGMIVNCGDGGRAGRICTSFTACTTHLSTNPFRCPPCLFFAVFGQRKPQALVGSNRPFHLRDVMPLGE
jgi:hypothetical protein